MSRAIALLLGLTTINVAALALTAAPAVANSIRVSGGLAQGVANALYCQLTGCTMTGALRWAAGTASAPGVAVSSEQTGLFLNGAGALGFSAAGTNVGDVEQAGWFPLVKVSGVNGSAGAPEYTFNTQTSTGLFLVGSGDLGISVAAAQTIDFQASKTTINTHITSGASASSNHAASSTCTSVTVSGTDTRGKITATCTAGQTVVMDFGTAYGAAPICTVTPIDTNAAAGTPFATTSTTQMTMTSKNTTTSAANFAYHCLE